MNIEELENRILLKELIDNVSILGDKKDFYAQVNLFTEDALSETFVGETSILKLKGRKDMAESFGAFLKDYEIVYHFNRPQLVTLNGDRAIGTCYCLITLIGTENGKKIKTAIGAVYQDDYIQTGNCWLIAKRIGYFNWQEKVALESQ